MCLMTHVSITHSPHIECLHTYSTCTCTVPTVHHVLVSCAYIHVCTYACACSCGWWLLDARGLSSISYHALADTSPASPQVLWRSTLQSRTSMTLRQYSSTPRPASPYQRMQLQAPSWQTSMSRMETVAQGAWQVLASLSLQVSSGTCHVWLSMSLCVCACVVV